MCIRYSYYFEYTSLWGFSHSFFLTSKMSCSVTIPLFEIWINLIIPHIPFCLLSTCSQMLVWIVCFVQGTNAKQPHNSLSKFHSKTLYNHFQKCWSMSFYCLKTLWKRLVCFFTIYWGCSMTDMCLLLLLVFTVKCNQFFSNRNKCTNYTFVTSILKNVLHN
jgi:hypothetical protein